MFNVGAIALGGVDLNNSLQWVDRYSSLDVAQSRALTLGGNVVSYSQAIVTGKSITLQALQDTGWFTFSMVEALRSLASVAAATYVFTYHGETYNVRFDHSSPPAVEFTPLITKSPGNYAADDFFTGTLRLFTV